MAGKISVDLDLLASAIITLQSLDTALMDQKDNIKNVNGQVSSALSGTDAVADFETRFTGWISQLMTLEGEIDAAVSALKNVQTQAADAMAALASV